MNNVYLYDETPRWNDITKSLDRKQDFEKNDPKIVENPISAKKDIWPENEV